MKQIFFLVAIMALSFTTIAQQKEALIPNGIKTGKSPSQRIISTDELNRLDGITSPLVEDADLINGNLLLNAKADTAGQAYTGPQDFTGAIPTAPTAAVGTNTTQLATMEAVQTAQNDALLKSSTLAVIQYMGSTLKSITAGLVAPGNGTYTLIDNTSYRAVMTPPIVATTYTGVRINITTAGVFTPDNFNGIALYNVSGSTETQVAISANDATVFTAGIGVVNIPFVTPYNASRNEVLMVRVLYNSSAQTTAPVLSSGSTWSAVGQTFFGMSNSFKLYAANSAQSTMAATYTTSGSSPDPKPILFGLY